MPLHSARMPRVLAGCGSRMASGVRSGGAPCGRGAAVCAAVPLCRCNGPQAESLSHRGHQAWVPAGAAGAGGSAREGRAGRAPIHPTMHPPVIVSYAQSNPLTQALWDGWAGVTPITMGTCFSSCSAFAFTKNRSRKSGEMRRRSPTRGELPLFCGPRSLRGAPSNLGLLQFWACA